jgi:hypothetical protein
MSFWAIIAIYAWLFAGSFTLASCWTLAVLFPTPVAVIFWGAIATLLVVSLIRVGRYLSVRERSVALLSVPIHFAILVVGISAEVAVAQISHPRPSCL